MALTPETNPEAIAQTLRARLDESGPSPELWEALAWCGAPGRALLDALVRGSAQAVGAAAALYRVDPPAGVAAMRERIITDLPVEASDALVLRDLDDHTVAVLKQCYQADPAADKRAAALGFTKHPAALSTLSAHTYLRHEQAQVRYAAACGLVAWYGNDLDQDGFAQLCEIALRDPLPELRRRVRAKLEDVGNSVPWVEAALDGVFNELYQDPTESELTDLESIAARLRRPGPATHTAVAMLLVEQASWRDRSARPYSTFRTGVTWEAGGEPDRGRGARRWPDVHRPGVCAPARDRRLTRGGSATRARRMFAAPHDPQVFDTLAACAGSHPHHCWRRRCSCTTCQRPSGSTRSAAPCRH